MIKGQDVIQLLQSRIQLFSRLRELLLEQQKSLIGTDTDQITHYAELQVNCIEEIQEQGNRLRELLNKVRERYQLSGTSDKQVIFWMVGESQADRIQGYFDQLKELAGEINRIKRNNTLLIHNSLVLVRSIMQQLNGSGMGDAFYHPHRKPVNGYALLNKKL